MCGPLSPLDCHIRHVSHPNVVYHGIRLALFVAAGFVRLQPNQLLRFSFVCVHDELASRAGLVTPTPRVYRHRTHFDVRRSGYLKVRMSGRYRGAPPPEISHFTMGLKCRNGLLDISFQRRAPLDLRGYDRVPSMGGKRLWPILNGKNREHFQRCQFSRLHFENDTATLEFSIRLQFEVSKLASSQTVYTCFWYCVIALYGSAVGIRRV